MKSSSVRGFTLLELLMSVAISMMVLTGITATFISQAQQYQSHESKRGQQSNARRAIQFIENALRTAGYGVEPWLALRAYDGFDVNAPTTQKLDYPDGLMMHARDPVFRRTVTNIVGTTISITPALEANGPMTLYGGQILLLVCTGANTWEYVTVSQKVETGGQIQVQTSAAGVNESPIGPPGSRFRGNGMTAECLKSAVLTKVERYAFYVDSFDDDKTAGTPPTPYLMLHRGLDTNGDNSVTAADATPLAAAIEQLQVAYVMNALPTAEPPVLGVTSAVPFGDAWAPLNTGPTLTDAYSAAIRRDTAFVANVRQVRVTVVARSPVRNAARTGDDVYPATTPASATEAFTSGTVAWQHVENLVRKPRPASLTAVAEPEVFTPSGGNYTRTVARISVTPKNLLMRSQFLPPNQWGG